MQVFPNRISAIKCLAIVGPLFNACEISKDNLTSDFKRLENIKSITTRFISRQGDTKNKDARVIAIAQFNVDGTVENVTQHMTYPYNYKEPQERHLWMQPDVRNLTHIMDGLDFGIADNNFLYGNDWPIKYAKIDASSHPKFQGKGIEGGIETQVSYASGEWPEEIRLKERFKSFVDEREMGGMTFYETFTNNGKFVTGYRDGVIPPPAMRKALEESIKREMKKGSQEEKLAKLRKETYGYSKEPKIRFFYENDLLERTEFLNKKYRFYYDEADQLIRSEFYIKDEMYNSRHYSYNENGLKTKTEIFNVDGEAEYTIEYEYEFYVAG